MGQRKPCGRPVAKKPCQYERAPGKQQCIWHWLMKQPADVQKRHAKARVTGTVRFARVPKGLWPDGERWCAGCQCFVPFFYCTGSRCKSCASEASHASRVESTYGITKEEYERLLRFQNGVCWICGRQPQTKRLAVDHDHKTGAVRGLLCANNERGCNAAIIANLEAAVDGGIMAARRALGYLLHPPYARMTGQPGRGGPTSSRGADLGPPVQSPPF